LSATLLPGAKSPAKDAAADKSDGGAGESNPHIDDHRIVINICIRPDGAQIKRKVAKPESGEAADDRAEQGECGDIYKESNHSSVSNLADTSTKTFSARLIARASACSGSSTTPCAIFAVVPKIPSMQA